MSAVMFPSVDRVDGSGSRVGISISAAKIGMARETKGSGSLSAPLRLVSELGQALDEHFCQ